jgi:prolyl-tRNA editing enzyme YbaK/EbsC (Cys-tRNA(Pro) deacylase)
MALHANAERVQRALAEAGSAALVRELPASTRTAAEAATALEVEVGQITKTLIFTAGDHPVMVLVSGADRVDTGRLSAHLGGVSVRRADPDAVRAATGFPIGGVSPVGCTTRLPVLVDAGLADFAVIWAAAGTPRAVFPTGFDELLRVTSGERADVAERPADPGQPAPPRS